MKRMAAILSLAATSAFAQTYTQMQWGIDKTVTPYKFGVNLSGTLSNLGSVNSSGVWTLNASNAPVSIDFFGAAGNGTTNDATALTNAMASLGSAGGIVELSCAKNYYIASDISIPANVTVKHCRGAGWHGNPGIDWTTGPIGSQPHVKLNPANSITMSSNSGYEGVILNSTLTFPVASGSGYSGTAIKMPASGSNDVHIDAMTVGFAKCFDGSAAFSNRYDIYLECDGNPPAATGAVILGQSFDSAVGEIRTYPWGTAAYVGGTNTRTGYGIQIVSGVNDDTTLTLLDYGHATGIVTAANGNIHFKHIWTDNNTSYGFLANGGDRNRIDYMALYNGLGARFNANGTFGIGYFLCDAGTTASAECIETGGGVSPVLNFGSIDIKKASLFAINLSSTTARLNIGAASFVNVHGNVGPYIVGSAGWTSDQIQFSTSPLTDLPAGGSLLGGNVQTFQTIASAATLPLKTNYDHFAITGSATIANITGTWNDRRIILTCATGATASINNAGNVVLSSAGTFTCSTGATIALWFDQSFSAKWREMWRN